MEAWWGSTQVHDVSGLAMQPLAGGQRAAGHRSLDLAYSADASHEVGFAMNEYDGGGSEKEDASMHGYWKDASTYGRGDGAYIWSCVADADRQVSSW